MSTNKISPEILAAIGGISGAILITIIIIIVVCKIKKDKEKKEKEKELEESKKNELNEKKKEKIKDKDKEVDSNNDKKEDKEEMKEDKNDNKNNKDTKIKVQKELKDKEIKFNENVNLEMSNIALKDKDATVDISTSRHNSIFSPNKSILKDEEIKIDKEKKSVLLAVGNEILHNLIEQAEEEYMEQMHSQHSQGSNKSANKKMKDQNLVELMNYSFGDRPSIYDDESEYIEEDDDKRQNEYKENQSELRKITIKLKEKIKNSQKEVKAEEETKEVMYGREKV